MGLAITILFVIFGGGYYFIRYLMESGQNEAFKQRVVRDKKSREDFEKLVYDDDLHDELITLLHDSPKTVDKIVKEVAGNESWFWKLNRYDTRDDIYLAKSGKLGVFNAISGMRCNSFRLESGIKYNEGYIARGEFILWIADQINKHGVETRAVVESSDGRYRWLTKDHPYEKGDYRYVWEQALSSSVDRVKLTDTYPEKEENKR